jgi:hypothetical protein
MILGLCVPLSAGIWSRGVLLAPRTHAVYQGCRSAPSPYTPQSPTNKPCPYLNLSGLPRLEDPPQKLGDLLDVSQLELLLLIAHEDEQLAYSLGHIKNNSRGRSWEITLWGWRISFSRGSGIRCIRSRRCLSRRSLRSVFRC